MRTESADAVSVLGLTSAGFVAAAEVRISRESIDRVAHFYAVPDEPLCLVVKPDGMVRHAVEALIRTLRFSTNNCLHE